VIPVFGHKNHVGIDRRRGFIRSFTITDTASHDGRQLGRPPTHSSYTTTWDVTRPVVSFSRWRSGRAIREMRHRLICTPCPSRVDTFLG
jgi:hypothetical protein